MNHADTVRFIKGQRIRLVGHIYRTNPFRNVKKLTELKPAETRGRGRPRKRCMGSELRVMKCGGEIQKLG